MSFPLIRMCRLILSQDMRRKWFLYVYRTNKIMRLVTMMTIMILMMIEALFRKEKLNSRMCRNPSLYTDYYVCDGIEFSYIMKNLHIN